jgi:RNA-directed DNA polymerase
MIDKWLTAGVMEQGQIRRTEEGSPQGGVISPLLANIYLHEVLDVWFEQDVRPRMRGRVRLIRYADDFVICFEREDDARRIAEVLPKRFAKYGLTLHPDKTRLLQFTQPGSDGGQGSTFDFLGFTLSPSVLTAFRHSVWMASPLLRGGPCETRSCAP